MHFDIPICTVSHQCNAFKETNFIGKKIEVGWNYYLKYSYLLRRLNVMPIVNKRNGDQKKLSPLPWNYLFKIQFIIKT
jgi:hypothetical protein